MQILSTPRNRAILGFLFVLLLLVTDQIIKIAVKTHMVLGQSIHITDWWYIYFTENPGMAFGWEVFNKAFLSVFRIVASGVLLWLIVRTIRGQFATSFLLCMCAIFAGAIGNIIDSIFYGVIFSDSVGKVATLFPAEGGYAGWLHGKVVDMFYFPLIHSTWPAWVPGVGGEEFIFFRPIFNFADACISVGVILLLLVYPRTFNRLVGDTSDKKLRPAHPGTLKKPTDAPNEK